jgi:Uma2 family endonuclease
MGMPAQKTDWTAEMVRALPDDRRRYEVLDGELHVSPSPSLPHQRVVGELFVALSRYLRETGIGDAMVSPADIEFSPRRMLQPDVFAFPTVAGRRPRSWRELLPLLLAVEVLSPSTARIDRQTKRRIYQGEGVPEFWVVDLDARLIERWRPADERPEVIAGILEWQPKAGIPPLRIVLTDLFNPDAD